MAVEPTGSLGVHQRKLRDMLAGLPSVQEHFLITEGTAEEKAAAAALLIDFWMPGDDEKCPLLVIEEDDWEAEGVYGGGSQAFTYGSSFFITIVMATPAEFQEGAPDEFTADALQTVKNRMAAIWDGLRGVAGRGGNLKVLNARGADEPRRTDKAKRGGRNGTKDRLAYVMRVEVQ